MKNETFQKTISFILKAIVIYYACMGTVLSARAGNNAFMGGTRVLMYFTIQSNLALAMISGIGIWFLLSRKPVPDWWYVVRFAGALSITLTGVVFCVVLAPTLGKFAWVKNNVYTHVIVPIAAILDFFVTCVKADIPKRKVVYVTLPPLAYAIYAGIGYICNWQFARGQNYPYFFLNWGSPAGAFGFCNGLPFMGCIWWILLLLVMLILVGLGYLAILDSLKKKLSK